MARDDSPPFPRGTYEPTDGAYAELIGKEWVFEDLDMAAGSGLGARPVRTEKKVVCRLVQNRSGAALLPKRLGRFKIDGTPAQALGVIDGYTRLTAERGFPIDEFLPAAGVPNLGYFWVVVEGPAVVKLPTHQEDFAAAIAVGDRLVALTAVTSGATTSGRINKEVLTGSSQATDYAFIVDQIANRVGRALSAAATTAGNGDLLIDVTKT